MVALWILGILLALILLVLFLRVGVRIAFGDELRVTAAAGPVRIQIVPSPPKKPKKQKKHKEKKNPPEKQKAAPREKRKLGLTPGDIRSALPYLWQSLKGALRKTRQRLRIDPMQVSVILGGEEDPAASAETYGWVSAAVWTFMPRLEELMRIPDPYIHLDVDYSAAETKAEGEVGLSFQHPGPVRHRLCLRYPSAEVAAPVEEGEKAPGGGPEGRKSRKAPGTCDQR